VFGERSDSRVLNSNGVEGFEAVDDTESFTVLLQNGKPTRSIGGVGGFVDACAHFPSDNGADFFVEARGYGNISLDPGDVRYDGEIDGREEVRSEAASF